MRLIWELLLLSCVIAPAAAAEPAVLESQQRRVDLIEHISPAVVAIFSDDAKGGGSGVLVSADGCVVTNFHGTLNPLVIDTEPKRHSGLGVDLYTNVSSPIRRYFDLVVQRQIVDFLLHRAQTYTKDALEKIRMNVEPVLKDLEMIKRRRTRYWIEKHFLAHLGEKFPALVLDSLKNRYRILLMDFLSVVEMKGESGLSLSEGQMIQVKAKKSDPWNDVLRVEVD